MDSEAKRAFEISKDCEIVLKIERGDDPIVVQLQTKSWFVDTESNGVWVKLMCLRATKVQFSVSSNNTINDPRDCALLMEMILTPRITSLTVTEWEEQVKGTESAKKKHTLEVKRYAKDIREIAEKEMLI